MSRPASGSRCAKYSRFTPVLVVAAALAALAGYLVAFRMGYALPGSLFWALSLISVCSLLWLGLREPEGREAVPLVAVLTLAWLLKSVFVPRAVPFFGSDPYLDLAGTDSIQSTGWFSIPPWSQEGDMPWPQDRTYPLLSGLSIAVSKMTGLSLTLWARWGPLTLSLVSVLFVYGIAQAIYGSRRVALLSSLGFALSYYSLMFHSLFVRESCAFVLFLAVIYAEVRSGDSGSIAFRVLAIIAAAGLVLTHHLTALMLVVLLGLSGFVHWLGWQSSRLKRVSARGPWTYMAYVLVALLAYWIYLRYTPLRIMRGLADDATREAGTVSIVASIVPNIPRYQATLLLQSVSSAILGALAIWGVHKYHAQQRGWQVVSVLWAGGLGLATGLSWLGLRGRLGSLPSRMEIFGYALLIPAACHTLSRGRRQRLAADILLGSVVALHCLGGLLRVPPYLYTGGERVAAGGEPRAVLLREEYDLFASLHPLPDSLVGRSYGRLAKVVNPGARYLADGDALVRLSSADFSYAILGESDHRDLPDGVTTLLQGTGVDKVYDSGPAELYAPSNSSPWHIATLRRMPDTGGGAGRIRSQDGTKEIGPWWAWLGVWLLLLAASWPSYQLLSLIGARSNTVTLLDTVGLQAEGVSLGMLWLFAGFVLLDLTHIAACAALPVVITLGALLAVRLRMRYRHRHTQGGQNLALGALVLAWSASIPAGALFEAVSDVSRSEPYTEFYVRESRGQAITVCVANRGRAADVLRIEWQLGDHRTVKMPSVAVEPGATHCEEASWTSLQDADGPLAMHFRLLPALDGNEEQTLRVWVR